MSAVNPEKTSQESVDHVESQLNLNDNPEARIKNPLAGIPRSTLLQNVTEFAQKKDLTHAVEMLKKGAIRECSFPNALHIS